MSDPNFIEVNEITDFIGYLRTIDWYDPWLIGLVGFHLMTTTTTLLTRKYGNCQIFIFFGLLLLVYFSETINEYAAHNWNIFSKQQYFDSKGLFISVVFSMPILLNCMLMVGIWLYQSTELMTTLKRAQLKERFKKEKIQNNLKTE